MKSYVEIVGTEAMTSLGLHPFDLWAIGEFTRENILSWLKRGNCLDGFPALYGHEDFHAVCGDIDIPWATEESSRSFDCLMKECYGYEVATGQREMPSTWIRRESH
jgi:hypothetical protein